MNFVLACLVAIAFAILIGRFGLVTRAREAGDYARQSLRVIRDRDLEDAAKERLLQRNAMSLFRLAGLITAGAVGALAIPLAAVLAIGHLGVSSWDEVIRALARPGFLIAATVIGVTVALWNRGRQ